MTKVDTALLPDCVMRKSSRARHLQLNITREGELHVVVPQRISLKQAQLFLLENLSWVESRQHLLKPKQPVTWPQHINLHAINCSWPLSLQIQGQRSRVQESIQNLQVCLPQHCLQQFKSVMARWLKQKAELELTPWMLNLSRRCNLPFGKLSVRGQKSQWGNCSRAGNICLNYKLLFLPAHYVEYVMIHELCHTKEFNHSPNFWRLVAKFSDNWRELAKEVRKADQLLPAWIT